MRIATPNRASHSYRQHLQAPPERVFPLLCPVREVDWASGWAPREVISASGVAETDCVFTTPADGGDEIWYVTHHDPKWLFLEFIRIRPGVTACRITIQLTGTGKECDADVTYAYTSLGPRGDELIGTFTAEHYRQFMQEWERELNHYLATGRRLGA